MASAHHFPSSSAASASSTSASGAVGAYADGAPSSLVVFICCFSLSLIMSVGDASAGDAECLSANGAPSSLVAGGGSLSAVSGSDFLSPMLSVDFRALFLSSTPSRAHCFSLSSLSLFYYFLLFLPRLLARNPTPVIGKKSFNQTFITQRSNGSI